MLFLSFLPDDVLDVSATEIPKPLEEKLNEEKYVFLIEIYVPMF